MDGAFEGKKNTDKWFPIRLVDATDFYTPETGIAFGDLTVKYGFEAATSESSYTVTTNEWKEQGDGNYWLQIGNSEFTSEGKYIVKVEAAIAYDYNFVVEIRDKTLAELIDEIGTAGTGLTDLGGMSTGMKAEIQTEAEEAIVAKHLDHLISVAGAVSGGTPTTTVFNTNLTEASDNHYERLHIHFITGNLAGETRRIIDYIGISKRITVYPAFLEAPADADEFVILAQGDLIHENFVVELLIPPAIDLADTKTVRVGMMVRTPYGDLYPDAFLTAAGSISIARSEDGGESWTEIVSGGACSKKAGLIYYDEVFDSGSGYEAGDMIRFEFWGQIASVNGETASILGTSGTDAFRYSHIREMSSSAIMDAVVDGTIDVEECLKILLAVLAGDMVRSVNTYTYEDQSGVVKVTEIVSANAVERTIA